MGKKSLVILIMILLSACSTIPSFHDTVSSDYEKVEKPDITLSKAFAECEVLGETARGKMVTNKLSEVDAYWKKRNIVVDKCMTSKGFKLK
jgi:type II secretory pathway component PulC